MLAAPGDWTNILYQALASRFEIEAVIVEKPISRAILFRRRVARIGLARALDQAVFSLLVVPILRARAKTRIETLRTRLKADSPVPQNRVVQVDSVNSATCIAELQRRSPEVVIVSGTRIITAQVLESVRAPFVNMHAGITPRYRGVHGAYWAFAEGRPELAGVTVHIVDKGIDTGAILGQARIATQADDSFVTYPYLQIEAGIPLMVDAVEAALAGRFVTVESPDASASQLRHHPGAVRYVTSRIRGGVD
jgi:methionyl-tRNA formyltransferase